MASFKIGDVVQLKSGSDEMTVNSISSGNDGDHVRVLWFKNGEVKDAIVHPDSIEIIED